jgi:hypothetical protein
MGMTINTDHYKDGRKYEPWDVIADWGLNYYTGNALKYISRAGRKTGNSYGQDLTKAITYLQKELDNIGYQRNMNVPAKQPAKKMMSVEEMFEDVERLERIKDLA